ncbi:MAG TPA: hypothetical protein VHO25_07965, partial [Polyangiaceae bacterium]|nr:hypothetical protein [Polyangiaceae bacterium]
MSAPDPIQRLADTWAERIRGSARGLIGGMGLLLIVAVAYLARGGTWPWRISAAVLAAAACWLVVRKWRAARRVF